MSCKNLWQVVTMPVLHLICTDVPIVGTGIEAQVARDSRTQIIAEGEGEIVFVDATCIKIKYDRTEASMI